MKNVTVSVTNAFHKRLFKMMREMPDPTGGLGTITRKGLEAEVTLHEAKMKAIKTYFMQEVPEPLDRTADKVTQLKWAADRVKTEPEPRAEDQIRWIRDLMASGEDPLLAYCKIVAIVEPAAAISFLLHRAENEALAA